MNHYYQQYHKVKGDGMTRSVSGEYLTGSSYKC